MLATAPYIIQHPNFSVKMYVSEKNDRNIEKEPDVMLRREYEGCSAVVKAGMRWFYNSVALKSKEGFLHKGSSLREGERCMISLIRVQTPERSLLGESTSHVSQTSAIL